MIKLEILDKEEYDFYWLIQDKKSTREKTRNAFSKYIEYVNSGKTIRDGYFDSNTNCTELFGVTWTTLLNHSRKLQQSGIIKRTETFKHKNRSLQEIQAMERNQLKNKLKKLIEKMDYSQLLELQNTWCRQNERDLGV